MSQFNSIFSPLSNKLARLAGITLLAVAALFASTQQMSAQTCVQNLSISLDGDCGVAITPAMVLLGSPAGTYVVRINDNSPTDSEVNAVSPASGWTYGVFRTDINAAGVLVCQGTIIVRDDQAPVFSGSQKAAWELFDTVLTWGGNLDEIQSVTASFWGNSSDYRSRPAFGAGSRWYVGRPYMTDSCEYAGLTPGTLPVDSFWLIDADGNGRTITGTAVPGVGGLSAYTVGSSQTGAFAPNFHASRNLQVKVTDYLESPQCDSLGFSHKLRRSWQFIDQRGNDTTLNQIIYFKRPDLRGSLADPFARTNASPSSTLDRGPGNLGQFGPFGTNPRRLAAPKYGEASSVNGIAEISFPNLGGDKMVSGTSAFSTYSNVYSASGQTFRDTISYELGTNTDFNSCYNFDSATSMRALLTTLYVAVDTLPSGQVDSISLFSASLKSNYSVSFTYKEFPACNSGKKFEVVTTVFDWCLGRQEFDTLIIKMEDKSAPVFAVHNSRVSSVIKGRATLGSFPRTSGDSVIISVGLNDCTASLRLPAKTGTRADLRDLSALFTWGVYDICTANNNTDRNGTGVTLNYKIQTRDSWNNDFYVDRTDFVDVNYTVAQMSGGPVALGLPIGEHRICIEAWDACNNASYDTLYFDVQDMVAPTMKCDDQLNVTLTSNSTTHWYIIRNGAAVSNREVSYHQNARV